MSVRKDVFIFILSLLFLFLIIHYFPSNKNVIQSFTKVQQYSLSLNNYKTEKNNPYHFQSLQQEYQNQLNKNKQKIEEIRIMTQQKNNLLDNINLSPMNTSKSKQMYSFTRSTRFPDIKDINPSLYEKPSMLNTRAASFGYGNKSQLINKHQDNPSPDRYIKSSIFEKSPHKGISIGLSRQDCKNISIFNQSRYPAPTDYSYHQKENSPNYTIRQKVKLPVIRIDSETPGPGQYVSQHIDKNGAAFVSKFRSFIGFKIHQPSPNKIHKRQTPALGPQTYNTLMPAAGKQLLSRHRTEKSFVFDKRPRETFYMESKAPGPGAYDTFSQFNR